MSNLTGATVSVLGAIIGLAIVAVLVSKNAQTPTVIGSAGTALSTVIGAAVQPVSNNNSALGGLGTSGLGTSGLNLGSIGGGLLGGNLGNVFGGSSGGFVDNGTFD